MDILWQDLRFALRGFRRNPACPLSLSKRRKAHPTRRTARRQRIDEEQASVSEAIQMSIDEIRTKVRNFERKIRRRNLREYVAAAFIAAGFTFYAWRYSPSTIVRVGHLSVAVGALFFAYQLHRRGSSRIQPKELGTMVVPIFISASSNASALSSMRVGDG
jgi:hypothetical protein